MRQAPRRPARALAPLTAPLRALALPLLAAALAGGCGRARARECGQLHAAINAGVTRTEALEAERGQRPGGSPAETARDLRRTSDLHRQTIATIQALPLADPALRPLAAEYVDALSKVATAADSTASALDLDRRDAALTSNELYMKMLDRQRRAVEH
ncbi:MAG: hypothetical protein EOO75_13955, partial [Myxococcales bacterium]